jgi:hypothetical protein
MAEVLTLTLNVNVEHLGDGRTTQLVVAQGSETSSIFAVKQRIEEVEGIKVETQRLLLLHEDDCKGDGKDDCSIANEMADNTVLHESCTLKLWVGEARFGWDPRTAHEISEYFVQTDRRTYTRTGAARMSTACSRTALLSNMSIYPPMPRRPHIDDVHTISIRVRADQYQHQHEIPVNEVYTRVYCGVTSAAGGHWEHAGQLRVWVSIPRAAVLTMRMYVTTVTMTGFPCRVIEYFVNGVRKNTRSWYISQLGEPPTPTAVPLELTWCVLGNPEVSAFEIVECEDDLVTIKD